MPIVLDHDLGLPAIELGATVRPVAPRHALWPAQLASFGLAAALLAIYALGWLVYRLRR